MQKAIDAYRQRVVDDKQRKNVLYKTRALVGRAPPLASDTYEEVCANRSGLKKRLTDSVIYQRTKVCVHHNACCVSERMFSCGGGIDTRQTAVIGESCDLR